MYQLPKLFIMCVMLLLDVHMSCVARQDNALTADPVVMRSGSATDIYATLLSSPNKLNPLSWIELPIIM